MKSVAIALFLLLALVSFARSTEASDIDRIEYLAVDHVVAFDKRDRGKDAVRPWERAKAEKEKSPNGNTPVIVSDSCGPAAFTYMGLPLTQYVAANNKQPVEQKVLAYLDEWCQVAKYTFDAPTLMQLRNWNGVRYFVASVPIYHDDQQRPYVADIDFIKRAGWISLKKPIKPLSAWVCFMPEDMAASELDAFRNAHWVKQGPREGFGEDDRGFCISHGVYLTHTLSSLRTKPNKDDEP